MFQALRQGLGYGLLALGLSFALACLSFLGYGQAQEWWYAATRPASAAPDLAETETGPTTTSAWSLTPLDLPAVDEAGKSLPDQPDRHSQRLPAGRDAESIEPALTLQIPKLRLSSPITEVGVSDGLYQVPAFVVGHHADSAKPGEPGNAVFTGHVDSIGEGRVFNRLGELGPGDRIVTRSASGARLWVVREVRAVDRLDTSVFGPTPGPTVTLYTCTGQWDWRTQDYSQRLVVRATPDTIPGYD